MVSDSLSYYKPSSKAWIAACVAFLVIGFIVLVLCSTRISVRVGTALQLGVEVNPVEQVVTPQTKGREI